MPAYLIIPNLTETKKLCNFYYSFPYTVFGMGEVLLASLSINYSLRFDMSKPLRSPVYFLSNLLGEFIDNDKISA
jgi:hypothetical protein